MPLKLQSLQRECSNDNDFSAGLPLRDTSYVKKINDVGKLLQASFRGLQNLTREEGIDLISSGKMVGILVHEDSHSVTEQL